MASRDSGCGCGALLLLALVGLLPLHPYLLALLLVVGLLAGATAVLMGVVAGQNRRRLLRIAANAEQRFAGDICRIEAGDGQLKGIGVALVNAAGRGLRLVLQLPLLQPAVNSFPAELERLRRHHRESEVMLRKLHDVRCVPEQIRPIPTFDLESLFDSSRLQDLRASFEEVVTLNDSCRALSRQRIL